MENIICQVCSKDFTGYKGLSSHIRQAHNIDSKKYYDMYYKKENENICSVCGKETPFLKLSKGYQKFCCISCSQKAEETRNKFKETFAKNHNGAENTFQIRSIQQKAEKLAHTEESEEKKKQSYIDRYGVDNPAKSKVIQQQIQQTNLERYGSKAYNREKGKKTMIEKYGHEHALQVPEIKEKQEQTCMDKFGVYNAYASNEIRRKIEQINLERYNATNPYGSIEIRDKIRKIMLDKYNVEYPLQSKEIQDKTKQTNLTKYGYEYPNQNEEVKQKIKDTKNKLLNDFILVNNCTPVQHLLKVYGSGWYQSKFFKLDYIYNNGVAFVKNEDIPKIEEYASIVHKSNCENELYQLLKSLNVSFIDLHNRTIIKPLELDLYLPELKIAIEYNGKYWHSIEAGTSKNYHLNKSLLCRSKGIRLIHIYEFEDFEEQKALLRSLIEGVDKYPEGDFNKNNFLDIPKPEIIYSDGYTIYGAGELKTI